MQPKTAAVNRWVLYALGIAALLALAVLVMCYQRPDSPTTRIATLGSHRVLSAGQLLNLEIKEQDQKRTVIVTDLHSKGATALKMDFDLQPDWYIELDRNNQIISYIAGGREYIWDFTGPVSKTYERKH